jgi:omega-hydroxypalmitate O-feruloyl transferase
MGKLDNIAGLSVTTLQPIMVTPAENTPKEILYLSNIDSQAEVRATCQTLHVYGACPKNHAVPAHVIRHAISKALVYYYPFAGRMRENADGKLEVWCTGEGAVFVEGSANCSLEEVGYLAQLTPFLKQLVYDYPMVYKHHDIPPLVIQVTRFRCGGFVLGLGVSHCMSDGLGFSQFLNAIADLARGAPLLSVTPVWKREILKPRSPPTVNFDHKEFAPINPSRSSVIDVNATGSPVPGSFLVTAQSLDKLKKNVLAGKMKDDEQNLYCSTFEALAAFVWKSRVKAVEISFDEEVRLYFAVNVRKLYKPPLPEGYYGNGFFGACVVASARVVREASLWDLVRMVKEEKARLTDEYLRSVIDFLDLHDPKPEVGPPSATELYLSDWSRMAFSQVDFGWGEAVNVTPASFPFVHVCIFLPPPITNTDAKRKNGIRVITCLPSEAMEIFKSEMGKLDM